MHPDQSKVCPEGLQGEESNCSELSSTEGGLCPRDPTSPSTLLKMTLKSRQGEKILRPPGPQTTSRQDFTNGGDRRPRREPHKQERMALKTTNPLLEVCQHLQNMPSGATFLDSVQHGQPPTSVMPICKRADSLTVWVPEVIEGPLSDVLGPRFGLWCRRAKKPGLRLAYIPGQLALHCPFLP